MSDVAPPTTIRSSLLPLAPHEPRLPAAPDRVIADLRSLHELVAELEGEVTEAHVVDLQGAETDLAHGHVARTLVTGGTLAAAVFDDGSLHDVVFRGVDLSNARLRRTSLQRVRFEQCKMTGVQVMESELRDVSFVECTLELANLRLSRLERVSLAGCKLHKTDLQGLRGNSVRLATCDLAGANFGKAEFLRSRVVDCALEELSGVAGLKGCMIDLIDAIELAPRLAAALGIVIAEPGPDES